MGKHDKAKEFEGKDIMYYLEHTEECELFVKGLKDDELTAGRIRTIYVRMNYGSGSAKELANYYDLPIRVIKDIASGKLFRSITRGIGES